MPLFLNRILNPLPFAAYFFKLLHVIILIFFFEFLLVNYTEYSFLGVTVNTQPPVALTSGSSTENSNIQIDLIFPIPKSNKFFSFLLFLL